MLKRPAASDVQKKPASADSDDGEKRGSGGRLCNLVKARNFESLWNNGELDPVVADAYRDLLKNKGRAGFKFRDQKRELVEGVMMKDDKGRVTVNVNSPVFKELSGKSRTAFSRGETHGTPPYAYTHS